VKTAGSRGSARRQRAPAVELTVRAGAAWITLARPATGNRLDAEMLAALVDACARAEDATEVRVVVIAARGAAFCTGLPDECPWPPPAWPEGIGAVAALTKPVVAAIQGEARGWGLALALACDLRLAARGATFVLPEAHAGRMPGGGVTGRLARMVGVARALELALVGTPLPAARALQWGLVSAVVPPRRLAGAVAELANGLAARAPLALRLAKEAVVKALDLPLAEGMRLEHDLYVLLQTTRDRREGVRAFLERRRPRFQAR
jgi:enoyl-CoA hydratase/carnithine racemase